MTAFGEVREEECPKCLGRVVYQYGNWHCGGYYKGEGCGWTTAKDVRAPDGRPLNGGMVTLERCPECGGAVIYNGNYFCENSGYECDWALPHPAVRKVDKAMSMRLVGYAEEDL